MTSARRKLFEKRAAVLVEQFANGQTDLTQGQFSEPLTIYVGDRLVSSPNNDYLEKMAREFGTYLASAGAQATTAEIVAFHESPMGFRAVVQGRTNFAGAWQNTMKVEYFCRMYGDDFEIEMLVVTDIADDAIAHLRTIQEATIAKGVSYD